MTYLEETLKKENVNLDPTTKQLMLLVCMTIHDDEEYQRFGLTVDNALAALIDNRENWFKVGRVSEDKEYRKRIAWILSTLVKVKALSVSDAHYFKFREFDTVLKELIYDICEYINLEIYFDGYSCEDACKMSSKKELLLVMIESGNIEFFVQDYEQDKKIHLFTDEQLRKILKLSIELGIYSYFI